LTTPETVEFCVSNEATVHVYGTSVYIYNLLILTLTHRSAARR